MDCRMDVCREGRMDGGMGGWIEIGWIGMDCCGMNKHGMNVGMRR